MTNEFDLALIQHTSGDEEIRYSETLQWFNCKLTSPAIPKNYMVQYSDGTLGYLDWYHGGKKTDDPVYMEIDIFKELVDLCNDGLAMLDKETMTFDQLAELSRNPYFWYEADYDEYEDIEVLNVYTPHSDKLAYWLLAKPIGPLCTTKVSKG